MNPIRWDNINQTSGLYNAATLANRQASQEMNNSFDTLQGVLNTEQQARNANFANQTSNNTIEVEQYLKGLGNQGVDAVQAAMDSGAIQNKIGSYGGQLSKEAQMLDGSNQLLRARTSANTEDAYNQQVAARVSRPLLEQWGLYNNMGTVEGDRLRDQFAQDNAEAFAASGDGARIQALATSTDIAERDAGRIEADYQQKKLGESIATRYSSQVDNGMAAADPLKIGEETGYYIRDDKNNLVVNPDATREDLDAFTQATTAARAAVPSMRNNMDAMEKELREKGFTVQQINELVDTNTKYAENQRYNETPEETRKFDSIQAGNDRRYGRKEDDAWANDTNPLIDVAAQLENTISSNETLKKTLEDSVWKKGSREKFTKFLENAAVNGIDVPDLLDGDGKVISKGGNYKIPSSMAGKVAGFFGDNWGTNETLQSIAIKYVTEPGFATEYAKHEDREKAEQDLLTQRSNVTAFGSNASRVATDIANTQARFLKADVDAANVARQAQQQKTGSSAGNSQNTASTATTENTDTEDPKANIANLEAVVAQQRADKKAQGLPYKSTPEFKELAQAKRDRTNATVANWFNVDLPTQDEMFGPSDEWTRMMQNKPTTALSIPAPQAVPEQNPAVSQQALQNTDNQIQSLYDSLGVSSNSTAPVASQPEQAKSENELVDSLYSNLTTPPASSSKKDLAKVAKTAKSVLPEMGISFSESITSIASGLPKLSSGDLSQLDIKEIASLLSVSGTAGVSPFVEKLQKELAARKESENLVFDEELRGLISGS